MQHFTTVLEKMEVRLADPIQYRLVGAEQDEHLEMNPLLGHELSIRFSGQTQCLNCHRKIKVFRQGFCYECFVNAPSAADCILKPELCMGHLGIGRDPAWEMAHHVQPHFVYLAATQSIKVGVTRSTQIPDRWIDQGAQRALAIAKVPYRKLAGLIEVALKQKFTDKTSWQAMVKGLDSTELSLEEARNQAFEALGPSFEPFFLYTEEILQLNYPIQAYPQKVSALNLLKQSNYTGRLRGIRGQYLLFEDGMVFNVRSSSGLVAQLSF
jgi:hypothetical protein